MSLLTKWRGFLRYTGLMPKSGLKQLGPGDVVPDLRLETLRGGSESLREAGGVLLVFFKISCPVCQLTLPYLQRIHPATKVWGVSQNGADDTQEFADYYKLTFPILLDPEDRFPASNAFGITHVPTTFLLAGSGRIDRVIEGWNRQEMQSLGAVTASDNVPAWKAG